MNYFKDYMEQSKTTAIYPGNGTDMGLGYCLTGLAGECGEVLEVIKKIYRDDNSKITNTSRHRLASEVSDMCWYIAQSLTEINSKAPIITSRFASIEGAAWSEFSRTKMNDFKPEFLKLQMHSFNIHSLVTEVLEVYKDYRLKPKNPFQIKYVEKVLLAILNAVIVLSNLIRVPFYNILKMNVDKLFARKKAGALKGSGESIKTRIKRNPSEY